MPRISIKIMAAFLFGCFLAGGFSVPSQAGEIRAKGAATDDFMLDPALTLGNPDFLLGAAIERDRMYMAARPGFQIKHIPFTFDEQGLPYSGGTFLFDTEEDAEDFYNWVSHDFILDGLLMPQRAYFINHAAAFYKVIGAYEFKSSRTSQHVLRTERWETPAHGGPAVELLLKVVYPLLVLEAYNRGYTAIWLLYNEEQRVVNIVTFDNREALPDPPAPDFATLNAMMAQPTMGKLFDALQWPKTFDRSSWVLSIWYPFEEGDSGEAALWPYSPPFPAPFIGDGICVPSRGENHDNAPEDCTPDCGDGVAQADETNANCPSDVEHD
ncbi:MAG TPA: hypothetical protein VJR29_13225 [bacterium]|nr:hypothetical protein [bacterium]